MYVKDRKKESVREAVCESKRPMRVYAKEKKRERKGALCERAS